MKNLKAMFSNSSNLYGSEWLALVFNNRNKNYGAYALRMQSSGILFKAFMIVAPLFTLLFVAPMIYAHFKAKPDTVIDVVVEPKVQDLTKIHEMKKEEPKKEEPAKAEPIKDPAPVKSVKLTNNIAIVKETIEEPPTAMQVQEAVIASTTQQGETGKVNAVEPSTNTGGGGGTAATGSVDPDIIYDAPGVDKYPEFPGGMTAWAKFLQKNLRYPYMAQESGVQGKVYVSFVVEPDGSISNVKLVKGIGAGCDEEAMRVIKKSPKWEPGVQNKQAVRVRYNMPINYTIQ